jgi:CBS domain-containing protein
MSKTAREAMTPGRPGAAVTLGAGAIGADDPVDEALRALIERDADTVAVVDGGEIVGIVTPGVLAASMEHTWTWSLLCR